MEKKTKAGLFRGKIHSTEGKILFGGGRRDAELHFPRRYEVMPLGGEGWEGLPTIRKI